MNKLIYKTLIIVLAVFASYMICDGSNESSVSRYEDNEFFLSELTPLSIEEIESKNIWDLGGCSVVDGPFYFWKCAYSDGKFGYQYFVCEDIGTYNYYPYGELWRAPNNTTAGFPTQAYLYQNKERESGMSIYDFGPRRFHAPGLYWSEPDMKASDYPGLWPYTFCAANPIRNIDPDGKDIFVLNHIGKVDAIIPNINFDMMVINDQDGYVKVLSEKI